MDSLSSDIPLKQCPKCKKFFAATLEFFSPDKRNKKHGLASWCRKCHCDHKNKYRARPEVKKHRSEQGKEYRSRPEVQERIRSQMKEYGKEYNLRPEVQERHREYRKTYNYHKRPENQERLKAYHKEYRQRPEVRATFKVHKSIRRARKQNVSGNYTLQQIQDLLKRQKYRCYYCDSTFERKKNKYIYHIDHTFPLSRVSGTDIPANDISYLVLACPHCNFSKHDKFPWEFPEGGKLL